jgi:hypothetical protein
LLPGIENVNELKKLADLERQAATIIEDLHSAIFLQIPPGPVHSDIMRDDAELLEKYDPECLQMTITESDVEHYSAITYYDRTANYFLGIWEAVDREEFIFTHLRCGLWEGRGGGRPLHYIFDISRRIAIILSGESLRPEAEGYIKLDPLQTSLLYVSSAPPTPIYANVQDGIVLDVDLNSPRACVRYISSQ